MSLRADVRSTGNEAIDTLAFLHLLEQLKVCWQTSVLLMAGAEAVRVDQRGGRSFFTPLVDLCADSTRSSNQNRELDPSIALTRQSCRPHVPNGFDGHDDSYGCFQTARYPTMCHGQYSQINKAEVELIRRWRSCTIWQKLSMYRNVLDMIMD